MERCEYTLAEVRAARRLLEDMELGRWPGRGMGVAAVNEVETIAAVYAVGEVLRAVEQRMRDTAATRAEHYRTGEAA